MSQVVITKGQAYIKGNGLRCMASRYDDATRICNKIVAKKNSVGNISGDFQCPERRCRQRIEVETRP